MDHAEFFRGLIRLHVLHHAATEPVYGLGLIAELRRHGYELSPGTLYTMLHGLEQRGYLRSEARRVDGHDRREYRATDLGLQALAEARDKVRELFHEMLQGEP